MSRDNPESFAFYESFYEAIAALPTQKMQNELFHAVCEYGLYGKKPKSISKTANAMFIGFAYQIDSAKSKRKTKKSNGDKGGRPKHSVSDTKPKNNSVLDKKPKNISVSREKPKSPNGNDNVKDNDNGRDKKIAYGKYQNVFLSPAQIQALRQDFPSDLMNRIERLSLYKSSSGKTYPDDAATIRLWADRDNDKQSVNHDDDEDTKQREKMLDDSYDEAMEAIWRDVDAQNAREKQEKGEDDAEKA